MTSTVNGSAAALPGRGALAVVAEGSRPAGLRARVPETRRPRFLQDKLQVPEPSFAILHRRRVSALLDEAIRHRVTLVCGPAGAGKTVACASWATSGHPARPAAWVTLDADDQRDWFWAYVSAALRRVPAVPEHAIEALADTSPQRFPLRLVEVAQSFTQPLVLVLDGVHEISDEEVLTGLDVLIRHAPPGLRVVMLARRPPALQLARLRVAGELADIGGADLACTAEEADAYFGLLGIRVAPAERNEVLRRTEGWMAGLRLAAMQAENGSSGRLTALTGDEPLVTDYLWDEVLAQQEPQTRDFLVRTSLMEEVSGDLADALTGASGGESLLARLSRENSLVTQTGEGEAYRYHPLLREVLTAELNREYGHEIPVLLQRAARWYSGAGRPLEAVRCAAAAQDWDLASQVLADAGADAVMTGGPAELESVLGLFPAGRATGDVAVAAAWASARLWSGDLAGAAGYLDSADSALSHAGEDRRRLAEPTLAALRVMCAVGSGRGPLAERASRGRVVAEAAQASAATTAEHRAAGLLWFALGVISVTRWDMAEARDALGHADRQLGAGGLSALQARARAWLALALACCGELTAAQRAADEARKHGASSAGTSYGRQASFLAALAFAQINLGRDDLMAAQRLLDEVDQGRVSQLPGEPPVPAVAQFLRAKVLLADGDPAAAAGLGRLRDTWPAAWPGLAAAVTVAEAEVSLRAGDTGRARALLLLADGSGPSRGDVTLAEGSLMLAEGDFDGALETVRPYLAAPAAGVAGPAGYGAGSPPGAGTARERIGALLVAGVARRRLGDGPAGAALVEAALGLAEPEAAYRVFLDGGAAVRSAITVLVPPTSQFAGFAGRVLERFDTQGSRLASAPGAADVRLTDSERAVLCFLPSHMTNEEISQALFLSVNTVKTHLRSAYRKLGVGSRREAIARGRRLGLLLARARRAHTPAGASRAGARPAGGGSARRPYPRRLT
jgi:LuxR family transcriptional regulator, maltose regulon positive regulatory protein